MMSATGLLDDYIDDDWSVASTAVDECAGIRINLIHIMYASPPEQIKHALGFSVDRTGKSHTDGACTKMTFKGKKPCHPLKQVIQYQ